MLVLLGILALSSPILNADSIDPSMLIKIGSDSPYLVIGDSYTLSWDDYDQSPTYDIYAFYELNKIAYFPIIEKGLKSTDLVKRGYYKWTAESWSKTIVPIQIIIFGFSSEKINMFGSRLANTC